MSSANKNPGPLARRVQAKPTMPSGTAPVKPTKPAPAQPEPVAVKPGEAPEPAKVKLPKPKPAVVALPPPKPPVRKHVPRWTKPSMQGELIWEQPGRQELPATCSAMAEISAEEQNASVVFRGRLVRLYQGRDNRPMLVFEVPPTVERREGEKKHKFGVRYFPWRFDWLCTPETASRQSTAFMEYPGQIVWLTLDPDKLAESEETWQTAKGELTTWYAAQALLSPEDKRASRKAAKMAKKAAVDTGGAAS